MKTSEMYYHFVASLHDQNESLLFKLVKPLNLCDLLRFASSGISASEIKIIILNRVATQRL